MIFLALLMATTVAAGDSSSSSSSSDDAYFRPSLSRATTLYFRERTLTKALTPSPQLVCQNTEPSDGCATRRIEFAECHKAETDDWSAWRCHGHGGDAENMLELHLLHIHCANNAIESCALTYTLRYNNVTLLEMAHKKLVGQCVALHDAGVYPFNQIALEIRLRTFLLIVILGMGGTALFALLLIYLGAVRFVWQTENGWAHYNLICYLYKLKDPEADAPVQSAAEKREN